MAKASKPKTPKEEIVVGQPNGAILIEDGDLPFDVNSQDLPFVMAEEQHEQGGIVNIESIPNKSDFIEREVAKFDPLVPLLEEYKTKYNHLSIKDIHDEEGYKEVSLAIRDINSRLSAVESLRVALKADSLAFGRAIDAKAKSIVAVVSPVKDSLKLLKDGIDKLKKEEEDRLEKEKQEKIKARHNTLISNGCTLVQNEYVFDRLQFACTEDGFIEKTIGEQECLHKVNIETMNDASFDAFINGLKELALVNNTSYTDAVTKQETINAEKARKKAAEEKEANDLKASMDAIKAQITSLRVSALAAIGLAAQQGNFFFVGGNLVCKKDELGQMPQDEWEKKLVFVQDEIKKFNEAEEARKKKIIADAEAKVAADAAKKAADEEARKNNAQLPDPQPQAFVPRPSIITSSTGSTGHYGSATGNLNNMAGIARSNTPQNADDAQLLQDKLKLQNYLVNLKLVPSPIMVTEHYKKIMEGIKRNLTI